MNASASMLCSNSLLMLVTFIIDCLILWVNKFNELLFLVNYRIITVFLYSEFIIKRFGFTEYLKMIYLIFNL